jgi:hypothetical protein
VCDHFVGAEAAAAAARDDVQRFKEEVCIHCALYRIFI